MSAGRMFLRECGAGREFVAMIPPMRHPNRLAEAERELAKSERAQRRAERSLQRYISISIRATRMICNPYADSAELATMRVSRAKRAAVMYARIAKMAKGGAR